MSKPLSEYRKQQNEWRIKKRAEREALGLCNRCGKPAHSGKKLCDDCNERGKKQHKEAYDERMIIIISYLGGKCADCEQVFPACVYDIHHLDPKEKEFSIAGNKVFLPWETLKAELDKCILLCANCHRIRHSKNDYH